MSQLGLVPIYRATDSNANPLANARLYTFLTGTTTPAPVYTTSDLSVSHGAYVQADSAGLLPAFYLDPVITYRVQIRISPYTSAVAGLDFDPVASTDAGGIAVTIPGTDTTLSLEALLAFGIPLMPEYFGAVGDGETNDTESFAALSAYVNDIGGATVRLARGAVYILGEQSLSGGIFYLNPIIPFDIRDVAFFTLDMNGATMKFADGLKWGSFDPNTGAVHNPSMPFVDFSYRAEVGTLVYLENVGKVRIEGPGHFDGNFANTEVGGEWGDTGRQVMHTAIRVESCGSLFLANLSGSQFGLDCLIVANTGLDETDPPRPVEMHNSVWTDAGRNTFSFVGGNRGTFINCTFGAAGGVMNTEAGLIGSAPKSCLDIEAEGAINENLEFIGCSFLASAETFAAVIADSGVSRNVTFTKCLIDGVCWPNKPGFRFVDCTIRGPIPDAAGGLVAGNAVFERCTLYDTPTEAAAPASGSVYFNAVGAGAGVIFYDCDFYLTRTFHDLRGAIARRCTVHWSAGTDHFDDEAEIVLLSATSELVDSSILDEITALAPANGYAVQVEGYVHNSKTEAGGKIKWANGSTGPTGYWGRYAAAYDPPDIAAGGTDDFDVVIQGAALGDKVNVAFGGALGGLGPIWGEVVSLHNVKTHWPNPTAGAINLTSNTLRIDVEKRKP